RYLGTYIEGVGEEATTLDCTTLIDPADGNSQVGMSPFQWTIPVPSGIGTGDMLTATATVTSLGTSVLSPVVVLQAPAALRLQKALPNGRVAATDQFQLTISGAAQTDTVTTTGTGTNAPESITRLVISGESYDLSEANAGTTSLSDYVSTYACTNALAGGQEPSGSGTDFTIVAAAGDDLTCTFVNTRTLGADLRISKTNTPDAGPDDQGDAPVPGGSQTTSTIVASSDGPDAADGASVIDLPESGLSSCVVTCSATTGGATCPAAPADLLTEDGTTIPVFPVDSSVTFLVTCTVD